MQFHRVLLWIIISLVVLMGLSCGGRKVRSGLTAAERLAVAKEMFAEGDYLDAKQQLSILTMSHQGSAVADEAQFYLAECHYHLEEYILAVSEYQRLINSYPNSEFVDDAVYKMGMSFLKRSPASGLDQEYSKKAIQHFQRFLEDYPNNRLRPEVEASLRVCREKLAKKEFNNGNLYRKMRYYRAALVYFDGVLELYYDTKYAEKANYWKAECLFKLDRFEEAQETLQTFVDRYPRSSLVDKARKRLGEIDSILEEQINTPANTNNPNHDQRPPHPL